MTLFLCPFLLQLCVPVKLYAVRTVGDRLRNGRPANSTNHPPKQIIVPSTPRRAEGRIVSQSNQFFKIYFKVRGL